MSGGFNTGAETRIHIVNFGTDCGQFGPYLVPEFLVQISKRSDEQDAQGYNEHSYGGYDMCAEGPVIAGHHVHRLVPLL